jgi:hypothetical protein
MTEINKTASSIECGFPWCEYHYLTPMGPVHYGTEALGRQHHEDAIASGSAERQQPPTVKVAPLQIVPFAEVDMTAPVYGDSVREMAEGLRSLRLNRMRHAESCPRWSLPKSGICSCGVGQVLDAVAEIASLAPPGTDGSKGEEARKQSALLVEGWETCHETVIRVLSRHLLGVQEVPR